MRLVIAFFLLTGLTVAPAYAEERMFTTPFMNTLCVYHDVVNERESFVYCIADDLTNISYYSSVRCINSEGNFNSERPYGFQFLLRGSGEVSIVCFPPRYLDDSSYLGYLYDERSENYGLVRVVPYGKTVKIGNISCNTGTLRTPLVCKTKNGNGFSISKSSQKIFRR
jgi:hypothetical protein